MFSVFGENYYIDLDKIENYVKQYSFELDSIYPENSNWGNALFINNKK